MPDLELIHATIEQYVSRFNAGDAQEWTALFTDDARQEDPVGAPVNVGHDAIATFYKSLQGVTSPQLSQVREPVVVGNEAMVFLTAVTNAPGRTITVPFIVDHMVFAEDGRIAALRAFFDMKSIVVEKH